MTLSDILQVVAILSTSILSIVSIIISVITLRKNSKMIEETTRPILSIYGSSINSGTPALYLVVKNFGSSAAIITKFDYDYDFSNCYRSSRDTDFLKYLINCTIAPGQSRICLLDYNKIDRPVTFDIAYKSTSKTYKESLTIDIKAGTAMITAKNDTKDKELSTISYTLQEMLQKNL
jgi:hypothetical protein